MVLHCAKLCEARPCSPYGRARTLEDCASALTPDLLSRRLSTSKVSEHDRKAERSLVCPGGTRSLAAPQSRPKVL